MRKQLLRSGALTLVSFVALYLGLVILYILLFMLGAMFSRQAYEPVPIFIVAVPVAVLGSLVIGIIHFFWTSNVDVPLSLLKDDTGQIDDDQFPTIKG